MVSFEELAAAGEVLLWPQHTSFNNYKTSRHMPTEKRRKGKRKRETSESDSRSAWPRIRCWGWITAQCLVRLLWDFPALPYEYTESSSKSPLQWQQVLIMLDTEWKEGAYKQPNSLPMMCSPWDSKLGLTFLLPELLLCLIHFISTNYNLQNIFTNNYHYY